MKNPQRILIVEDNKYDLGLVLRKLERSSIPFEYHHVMNGEDFKKALVTFKPGLILSDYSLPAFSGLEAIEINNKNSDETPLIIVSGTIGEEKAAEVIRAGAADYVLKQHLDKLPLAIDRVMNEAEEKRGRKEAEFKSKQQQGLLNAIINQTGSVIYVKDSKGKYKLVNDTFLESFGLRREDVINKSYREVHGDASAEEIENNDAMVMQTGSSLTTRRQHPVRNSLRYFHTIKYRLQGVPGFENCLCGISIDISQQVQMENRIKENEKRLEQLVQNNPDLIQITAADGTILFINPAGAEMYGVDDPGLLVGKKYLDQIDMDNAEMASSQILKVLQGEEVPPIVHKITTKKGVERHLEVQSVPFTLEDGQTGLQFVAKNITDRIRNEMEIKESLKEKEILLQEIHHRVKNNLAVVSGLLELQKINTNDQVLDEILSNSQNRIKSIALIHEKLYESDSLSRINFEEYLEGLIQTVRKTIDVKNNIQVELKCDPASLNVNQALPCALIVNELVSNSYQHAFKRNGNGQIRVELTENSNNMVTIGVSDNGSGFKMNKNKPNMGYTIINALITQLGSELKFGYEDGFSVSFTFSKRDKKGSVSSFI